MAKASHKLRKLHNIVGLVFGIQMLFWVASGLFFTLFPIEQVRGSNLRVPIDHGQLVFDDAPISAAQAADALRTRAPVKAAELGTFLGEPVWRMQSGHETLMVSATTGELRSPITSQEASLIAAKGMREVSGTPGEAWLLTANAPREYGGPLPVYVVDYAPGTLRVYISPDTGQLLSVRSKLWRTFDVLWRFHIMDITGSDRFDSWWLKVFSFFGLTLVLSGTLLVVRRVRYGTIFH